MLLMGMRAGVLGYLGRVLVCVWDGAVQGWFGGFLLVLAELGAGDWAVILSNFLLRIYLLRI